MGGLAHVYAHRVSNCDEDMETELSCPSEPGEKTALVSVSQLMTEREHIFERFGQIFEWEPINGSLSKYHDIVEIYRNTVKI